MYYYIDGTITCYHGTWISRRKSILFNQIWLGRQNTENEVKYATMTIVNAANKLKKISMLNSNYTSNKYYILDRTL